MADLMAALLADRLVVMTVGSKVEPMVEKKAVKKVELTVEKKVVLLAVN